MPQNLTINLTAKIKEKAQQLGFSLVGIAKAEALEPEARRLEQWLEQGFHGRMHYMANHFAKRVDPTQLVPGAKSVICVAMNYYNENTHAKDQSIGKISRYAWGDDYHDVLKKHLRELFAFIKELDATAEGRSFVDSAPVMEKAWAVKSGIGWLGKNANIIDREYGSWFFLGELIVNLELEYDEPIKDYCGSCSLCMESCPTDAIREPYVVDANLCISYLTIELKPEFEIPESLAQKLDNWVFGCDICQEVCPWNEKFAKPGSQSEFLPRPKNLSSSLEDLAQLTQEEFSKRFRKSPVKRPKWKGFLRNVKAALANFQRSIYAQKRKS